MNNLLEFPGEPFYSHIKKKYGEEASFDPIKLISELEGITTDQAFSWIEWLNWHLQIKDYVKWNVKSGKFVNKNILSCTDAHILYWLILCNTEVRNEKNFRHYISLFDQNKEKSYPEPFEIWSMIPNLQTEKWSEYFLKRQFTEFVKPSSKKVLIQNIPNLIPQIKPVWLSWFLQTPHTSHDIMHLLLKDNSLQSEENYAYFRSLNPKPYEICRLLLQRANAESTDSFHLIKDSFDWFQFYAESNGDIKLLIYTMHSILSEIANFKFNKFFWMEFLAYFYSDFEKLNTMMTESENQVLKSKWMDLTEKIFMDDDDI